VSESRKRRHVSGGTKLPKGAEAAIWSILEPLPDPRNHLALTRDLSGEVHITELDRVLAATASREPVEPIIDIRSAVDSYYDLGALEENAPLTNEFFSPSLGHDAALLSSPSEA
jgi:hypothetical protein